MERILTNARLLLLTLALISIMHARGSNVVVVIE